MNNELSIYTDGSCKGNPGPMGIGIVILRDHDNRSEISKYMGIGTNNQSELLAIKHALSMVCEDIPICIHTDSTYCIGVLSKGWKANKNQELIECIRMIIQCRRGYTRFVKVKAHANVKENNRCDVLAKQSINRQYTSCLQIESP
jgi:ribonuclease HI